MCFFAFFKEKGIISFLFVILCFLLFLDFVTVILLIIVFKVDKVAKTNGKKNTSCTSRKHTFIQQDGDVNS